MFLVFQTMLNSSFLIRLFVNFPFHSENGSLRVISFRSSNNHFWDHIIIFILTEIFNDIPDKVSRETSGLKHFSYAF